MLRARYQIVLNYVVKFQVYYVVHTDGLRAQERPEEVRRDTYS